MSYAKLTIFMSKLIFPTYPRANVRNLKVPPGTLGVQLCLNIQFVQYYMGILYFLDYFLTPITSATVISVHAKAHYGRAKITQW